MTRIMLVDDDSNVLTALRREFAARRAGASITVEPFTSAQRALQRAEEAAFDLVIADYSMPEMDGVSFLEALHQVQPDAARMLLSGNVDMEGLARAINRTHIYRFIPKPWSEIGLTGAVAQALAYRRVVLENRKLADTYREAFGRPADNPAGRSHYQVLLVDDEPNVVHAMGRELSHESPLQELYAAMYREAHPEFALDTGEFRFSVDACTVPRKALDHAWAKDYDLVIADYRMPEMDGISFLESFRRIRPDAGRILLSGQADMEVLMEAVNRAEIFSFIEKPWTELELRMAVTQAITWRVLQLENAELARQVEEWSGRR
ncbi:MAG TPA: response regulator [Burkholderiales bacterium]|nr:response regulator [Burkholderiales bacterium]